MIPVAVHVPAVPIIPGKSSSCNAVIQSHASCLQDITKRMVGARYVRGRNAAAIGEKQLETTANRSPRCCETGWRAKQATGVEGDRSLLVEGSGAIIERSGPRVYQADRRGKTKGSLSSCWWNEEQVSFG